MAREITPESKRAESVARVFYSRWTDWAAREAMGIR
jgi:hypothetical protein